jgi:protein-disulfide isomerase
MMSKQGRDQNRTQRAAAIRAEQARKERNRRVALIAGIIVLLGAIVAGGAWYGSGGNDKPSSASGLPTLSAGEVSLKMGKSDAPVKVVIYEDFQCPICRELESATRTFLRENAAKGKVYVEFQPIHLLSTLPYSGKALNAWAAVLHSASPEAALKLHDLLYDNQPYEQDSASITDEQIAGWVKEAGGDNATVREALKTRDDTFFTVVDNLMRSEGIQGTPTVYVNGQQLPLGSVPDTVSKIEAAVDQGS